MGKKLAITVFLVGVLSLFLLLLRPYGLPLGILAVLLGVLSVLLCVTRADSHEGLGFASLGLLFGVLGVGFIILTSPLVYESLSLSNMQYLLDEPQVQVVSCVKPYLLVGTSCCLDSNDDLICDDDQVFSSPQVSETLDLEPEPSVTDETDAETRSQDVSSDSQVSSLKTESSDLDMLASEIAMQTAYLDSMDFTYIKSALATKALTLKANDRGVVVARIKNTYTTGNPVYFRVLVTSDRVSSWFVDGNESSDDTVIYGPYVLTSEPYFDIPIIIQPEEYDGYRRISSGRTYTMRFDFSSSFYDSTGYEQYGDMRSLTVTVE